MYDIQTIHSSGCTENGGEEVLVRHLVVILWIFLTLKLRFITYNEVQSV